MAQLFFGEGVKRSSLDYPDDKAMPILLTDNHRVLEVPTLWLNSVSKENSRSRDTLHNSAHILARYLRWLDEFGYSSSQWDMVDEEIFIKYLEYVTSGGVGHLSLLYYCSRILAFYTWARRKRYRHHLELQKDDAERVVNIVLKDQLMLAHVNSTVQVKRIGIDLPTGRTVFHEKEAQRFVTLENHKAMMSCMDDMVYQVIAAIIWTVGLRPKDLFQLPYRGRDSNVGFEPHNPDAIPTDLPSREIHYYFRSKGKHRSIEFPGQLWSIICQRYLPVRRERALQYLEKHGVSPRNDHLFLNKDGLIVNAKMLRDNFASALERARATGLVGENVKKYTPRTLRHSCATYFVYEHLKRSDELGKKYTYNPVVDEQLRRMLGHENIETTYKFYVHLVNRYHHEDLLADLKRTHVDDAMNSLLSSMNY